MNGFHGKMSRRERNFEASRTHPPTRTGQGPRLAALQARDDVRRRWAKRTASAHHLRALFGALQAANTGAVSLPETPLTAVLLAPQDLRNCAGSCLCRLEKHEHLELGALLQAAQHQRDHWRAQTADENLNLEDLLR